MLVICEKKETNDVQSAFWATTKHNEQSLKIMQHIPERMLHKCCADSLFKS